MKFKTKSLNILRSVLKIPLLEESLKRLVKDKSSNSFLGKLVPNNYQYQKGSWRVCKKNGINLKLDIHDYVGHYMYFQFKDAGQERLVSFAKKGDYVLDIGTNIGVTLLNFAQKVAREGMVYGFEPDPENYGYCIQNIGLNSFTNIQLENFGLGKENGTFSMVVDTESNRGCNRITFDESRKESYEVKVETLDNWAFEVGLSKLDLVKIDVEGFEFQVLSGGKSLLAKYKPTMFIELDDNNLKSVGDSAKEVISFLFNQLGYKTIVKAENDQIISIDDDFSNCHFDIVVNN